ncbi:MAG: hypothetical protein ACJ768_11160 [Gaiellaceae bacterium]
MLAQSGSLEYFLDERYCLDMLDDERRVHRADIHHPRPCSPPRRS